MIFDPTVNVGLDRVPVAHAVSASSFLDAVVESFAPHRLVCGATAAYLGKPVGGGSSVGEQRSRCLIRSKCVLQLVSVWPKLGKAGKCQEVFKLIVGDVASDFVRIVGPSLLCNKLGLI